MRAATLVISAMPKWTTPATRSASRSATCASMRVSAEVLRAISPLAIEAALQLIADRERGGAERLRQSELALEQARHEATHARRQYDAVDPDNRLVAGELERRWNERLAAVARLEDQVRSLQYEQPRVLCDDERATLLALADDLPGYGTIRPRPAQPANGSYGPSSRRLSLPSRPIGCASCCIGRAPITRGLKW